VADTSLSGAREARELDRLMIGRGEPKMIVSDNGSKLILTWANQARVEWHYIAPANLCRTLSRALTAGYGTSC
jgi:putative transposase